MRHDQLASLLLGLATAAALAGCAPNDSDTRVLILHNQSSGSAGACDLTPSEDAFIPYGVIDTQSLQGYVLAPLLKNFTTVPADLSLTQRMFFMEGADITIDIVTPGVIDPADIETMQSNGTLAFSTRFTGVVNPDEGVAALAFEIIPKDVLDTIAAATNAQVQTSVEVQIFGTMGGGDLATQVFTYPVTVCTGCLKVNLGPCTAVPQEYQAAQGGGCNIAQDSLLECCTGSGGAEICPATAEEEPDPA